MADIDITFDGVYWAKDENDDLYPRTTPLPLADYDEVKLDVPYLEGFGTMPTGMIISIYPKPERK